VEGVCPACPDGGGGGEREGGDWHLNPGHLPRVTGYSLSMVFSHDQSG
jgi:hypothetical protein